MLDTTDALPHLANIHLMADYATNVVLNMQAVKDLAQLEEDKMRSLHLAHQWSRRRHPVARFTTPCMTSELFLAYNLFASTS